MAFYTEQQVRDVARQAGAYTTVGAQQTLRRDAKSWRQSFDIFLSHAFLDAQLILGVKALLEATGLTVYVDWIDDPELDRALVTASTAAQIRKRMRQSNALIFATSRASVESKWMPWELGFFDAYRGSERVSIFPLVASADRTFRGQEYLGLYPVVQHLRRPSDYVGVPVVTRGTQHSAAKSLRGFANGGEEYGSTRYF